MSKCVKKKLLLLGSLPPPVGGTTVLFQQLVDDLVNDTRFDVETINTSNIRGRGLAGLILYINTVFKSFIKSYDVISLHCSLTAVDYIGLPLVVVARLRRRPLVLRLFGGVGPSSLNFMRKTLVGIVFKRVSLLMVETKQLVDMLGNNDVGRIMWYPNSRPMDKITIERRGPCRNFVFIGHIKKSKGIDEIISASRTIKSFVTINIYGPVCDGYDVNKLLHCSNIKYHGEVDPSAVPELLRKADAVLLPTYYEGEGYPGIILEAYAAGIPVISTVWKAIPEIVNEKTGVLIEPKDASALASAITKLSCDCDFYRQLCNGVKQQRLFYSKDSWYETFLGACGLTDNEMLTTLLGDGKCVE